MVLSILFVWSPLSVRAETIDTEHLFAFTIGTDPGELGEKEIEGQTTGRLGKRDGSYTGLSQTLSAEFTPVQNFRLVVSAASIYQDISGVTGLDDRRRGGWQALSLDLRYRLLDRYHTSFGLLIDKELIPNRLVVAFNALYSPEVTRSRVTGITFQESTLGFPTALMAQVRPGIFVGAEARYLRRYEGLGLDRFAGHALFIGPTIYANLSEHSWVALAWSTQVAGRSVDDPGRLDLTNFERHQARVLFGFTF